MLGTNNFEMNIFARKIIAAKISLFVGAVVALISTSIGTVIGIVSGYYRKADFVLMRIIDGLLAFPSLLLALALVAALGGNLTNIIDRKSTRLNSSHVAISYAVFCSKKKSDS